MSCSSSDCCSPGVPEQNQLMASGPEQAARTTRRPADAATTSDVVYTPDWAARHMVEHFRPAGSVLEPCKGAGVFMPYLPGAEWCEIAEGRDFFDWHTPVDWIIGNPPYSLTRKWFRHSYGLADNIVYLVPLRNVFGAYGFLEEIREYRRHQGDRRVRNRQQVGLPDGQRSWRVPPTTRLARRPCNGLPPARTGTAHRMNETPDATDVPSTVGQWQPRSITCPRCNGHCSVCGGDVGYAMRLIEQGRRLEREAR